MNGLFSIKYPWNRRDATYSTLGHRTQSPATFGTFYTLLGSDRFGVVSTMRGIRLKFLYFLE